jgi:hypothetical protein
VDPGETIPDYPQGDSNSLRFHLKNAAICHGGGEGQNTWLDTGKLAEMLQMIPAEKRAESLRSLADYLDINRKSKE